MEAFEWEGVFWCPSLPERTVVGQLTYQPADGTLLKVFGSLVDLGETLAPEVAPIRIVGVAGGRELTLHGCYHRQTHIQMPGIEIHNYKVLQVLSGAHFDSEDFEFDEVAVSFDQLASWVDKSGFSINLDMEIPDKLSTATQIRLRYDVIPTEVVTIDETQVELTHTWSVEGDRLAAMQIGQQTHLKIKYPELRSLSDVLVDLNGLQDLITLATDAPSVPTEIKLWRPDVVHDGDPGSPAQRAIDLYVENAAVHVAVEPRSLHQMFFPYEQLGGLSVVARWIAVSRKYRPVLGALLTIRYSARIYVENRYLNVMSAAETFHRMRFANEVMPKVEYKALRRKIVKSIKSILGSKIGNGLHDQLNYANEPRLRARLLELANYAGEAFSWLVGDTAKWARIVTRARNRMTHHDQQQDVGASHTDIYVLADSVYVLVMLCLLRECDPSTDVLLRIRDTQRIIRLRQQLGAIADR
jgi:hypothetical protein